MNLPNGTSKRTSSDKLEGTISLPLEYPGGGSVSVQLQASLGGSMGSATASASLSPCAGPTPPSGPNLPELSDHTRDVDNSLQGLLDKIFDLRQPQTPMQPPADGVSRDTINPGRASSCLRPVPTPEQRAQGPRTGGAGYTRVAPKRELVAAPTKVHPLDKTTRKPVQDQPMATGGVKPVLELGANGEMEKLFYTCIGKKFLVSRPDGTVTVECRGIEIVW